MQIPDNRFWFRQSFTPGRAFTVHLIEETYPSGYTVYEAIDDEPNMKVGKTYYWTNTAGATSSRRYLGFVPVELVEQ
jgi:hypothetical protein